MLFWCKIINLYDETIWVLKSLDYFFLCQSVNGFLFWCVWFIMCIIQRICLKRNRTDYYSFRLLFQIMQIFILFSWIWRKITIWKLNGVSKQCGSSLLLRADFGPHYSYWLISHSSVAHWNTKISTTSEMLR